MLFQFINPCRFVVKLYSTSSSKQTEPAQISKANSFLIFIEFKKGGTQTCNEAWKQKNVILIKYETNVAEFSFLLNTFFVMVRIKYTIIQQVYCFFMPH